MTVERVPVARSPKESWNLSKPTLRPRVDAKNIRFSAATIEDTLPTSAGPYHLVEMLQKKKPKRAESIVADER